MSPGQELRISWIRLTPMAVRIAIRLKPWSSPNAFLIEVAAAGRNSMDSHTGGCGRTVEVHLTGVPA